MNRNVESRFSQLPRVEIPRSIFDRSSSHKTSFNAGDLVPLYIDEVLPGDTFRIKTSKVVRLQTLLTPIMDNVYLDIYWFFVPNRLTWEHWQQFCGENTQSAWAPTATYTIPKMKSPEGGFDSGTIADYFGIPVGVDFQTGERIPSALPFRAYALICDTFFRDENLSDPLNISKGDANQQGSNGSDYINDVANGGKPFRAAKYHDYFTSCLPAPQKSGDPVGFPIGFSGLAPIVTGDTIPLPTDSVNPMHFYLTPANDGIFDSTNLTFRYFSDSNHGSIPAISPVDSGNYTKMGILPNNLYADIPASSATANITINDLRLAFSLQRFFEQLARSGSRYIELLSGVFGVQSPDARLQLPEYLGGNRIPIQIHQVTNTAQAEQDFLGDLGAMSVTHDVHEDFDKSFTEHGYLMCLGVIRYDHTYSQGLERFWSRNSFTDFYIPTFANIGEQPVFSSEIFFDPQNQDDVFGYQEAWADYRYKPNRVSGEMRPGITNSLASWHLADYYTEVPTLSDGWIREDKTNLDRALAVTSEVSNQAFLDIYFECVCTRPMPMYSIPMLEGHF